MSATYTDESGNFWTLPELIADLEVGGNLYLTPKMCKDLAALLREHAPEANAQAETAPKMRLRDLPEANQLAADIRDAKRYRWLRSQECWDYPIVSLHYDDYSTLDGEDLDAAVDKAMLSTQPQGRT